MPTYKPTRLHCLIPTSVLGDWHVANNGSDIITGEGINYLVMAPGESSAEIQRNARLISATPDMASALVAMLDATGNCATGQLGEAQQLAADALRKAGIIA